LDWNEALREAEAVADQYLEKTGVRSGDLLHVASAVALNAEEFCTFDRRQADLAKRVGLKVKTWR
jgi:predicted nucleic acid-binding protein